MLELLGDECFGTHRRVDWTNLRPLLLPVASTLTGWFYRSESSAEFLRSVGLERNSLSYRNLEFRSQTRL